MQLHAMSLIKATLPVLYFMVAEEMFKIYCGCLIGYHVQSAPIRLEGKSVPCTHELVIQARLKFTPPAHSFRPEVMFKYLASHHPIHDP
ncbi:Alpha,alpha-trehalose-phosphate synthase [UDP-forming] 1 [Venturia inaequalis]|nr:Alpha,alpha-trehalose-phosphate synthase [UDP-forming] 1 [Venturia inaequalis]